MGADAEDLRYPHSDREWDRIECERDLARQAATQAPPPPRVDVDGVHGVTVEVACKACETKGCRDCDERGVVDHAVHPACVCLACAGYGCDADGDGCPVCAGYGFFESVHERLATEMMVCDEYLPRDAARERIETETEKARAA